MKRLLLVTALAVGLTGTSFATGFGSLRACGTSFGCQQNTRVIQQRVVVRQRRVVPQQRVKVRVQSRAHFRQAPQVQVNVNQKSQRRGGILSRLFRR